MVRVGPLIARLAIVSRARIGLVGFALLSFTTLALATWWLRARPYVDTTSRDSSIAMVAPAPIERRDGGANQPTDAATEAGHSRFDQPQTLDETSLQAPETLRSPQLSQLRTTHNVLLLGVDRQPGVSRGGRTDTLMVAAFSNDGHLGVISIPRDLYVQIPGEEPNRINAVWGLARRAKKDPQKALERVIEDTLGLPIAHTLAIDLGVFETVIDAVGGVTVLVDCPIVDRFIDPRVDGGRRLLQLDAGPQRLDGIVAGMFVRSRHGRSDWSRARRQQLVLRSLHAQLSSIDGLAMLPTVFGIVEESIISDMTRLELLSLARRVLDQDPRKVHGVVIGRKEVSYHRTEQNWSVLLPEREAIEQKLAGLFKAPAPGTRPAAAECPPADAALRGR